MAASAACWRRYTCRINGSPTAQRSFVVYSVGAVFLLFIGLQFVKTIPPGRVGVATLFGSVVTTGYNQGIHIPVNPLYRWTMYDARQKTHLETANVPSQDQLQTKLDVSVQYCIDGTMASRILEQIGNAQAFEIAQINNAISSNPAYIQLQSLEALKAISKDPASKVYFL